MSKEVALAYEVHYFRLKFVSDVLAGEIVSRNDVTGAEGATAPETLRQKDR
ncbi:hypothetical protein GCM10009113_20470 [Marinobacter szutsaonensis]